METASKITYSVVVPVYNTEAYLAECLNSILAQDTLSEYEIILVDDGSTDGSGAICDQYAAEYAFICVIHTKNAGASAARNTGISAAQGEYILFLDSDDLWTPDCLSTLGSLLEHQPDAIFLCAETFGGMESKEVFRPHRVPSGESGKDWVQAVLALDDDCFGTCFYGYRRTFLNMHNFRFSSELKVAEDIEFNLRALDAAGSVWGTDRVLYLYRMRAGSLDHSVSQKNLLDRLTIEALLFRKYPKAKTANNYGHLAMRVGRLDGGSIERETIRFIRDNWDIWNYVTDWRCKVAYVLFRVFGCHYGSKLFGVLISIKHLLFGRPERTA